MDHEKEERLSQLRGGLQAVGKSNLSPENQALACEAILFLLQAEEAYMSEEEYFAQRGA